MFSALLPAYIPRRLRSRLGLVIVFVAGAFMASRSWPAYALFIFVFATAFGSILENIHKWPPARLVPNLLTAHLLFSLTLLSAISLVYILINPGSSTGSFSLAFFAIAVGLINAMGKYKHLSWLLVSLPILVLNDSLRASLAGLMKHQAWNLILIAAGTFLFWQVFKHLLSEQNSARPGSNKIPAKNFLKFPIRHMPQSTARNSILKQCSLEGSLSSLWIVAFIIAWTYGESRLNPDNGAIDIPLAIAGFGGIVAALVPTGYVGKAGKLREFLWLSGATSTRTGVIVTLFSNCLRPCLAMVSLLIGLVLLLQMSGLAKDPSLPLAILLCIPAAASMLLGFALEYAYGNDGHETVPIGLGILMVAILMGCNLFAFWASGFELVQTIAICLTFSLIMSFLSLGLTVQSFNKQNTI